MKKVLTFAILIFASVLTFACKDGAKIRMAKVSTFFIMLMNKDMFIKRCIRLREIAGLEI